MFQNIGPFSHPPKQALLPKNGTPMPFDDILSRKNFDEKKEIKLTCREDSIHCKTMNS
jgi:hypothetical protein